MWLFRWFTRRRPTTTGLRPVIALRARATRVQALEARATRVQALTATSTRISSLRAEF